MSSGGGTLELLVVQLAKLLSPLTSLTPTGSTVLLQELGLALSDAQINAIAPALTQATTDTGQLLEQIIKLETAIESEAWAQVIEQSLAAVKQISKVISDFEQLKTAIVNLNIPNVGSILAELPDQLLNYLLASYFGSSTGVMQVFEILGLVQRYRSQCVSV